MISSDTLKILRFTCPVMRMLKHLSVFLAILSISLTASAQQITPDSTVYEPENTSDEYVMADSMSVSIADTSSTVLESKIDYSSDDSIVISVSKQKIYLFGNSNVDYEDVNLKSEYIEFNLDDNTVTATGMPDSTGAMAGRPVFTKGSETFDSDTLRYNFESQKGVIKKIITQQGEGYLHSEKTKRLETGEIHIATGKYTTCDAPEPHFYIHLTKAIAVPDEKIVSGPAYLVVEDIPIPLALPFGYFPYTSTRSTGLIIPTYGEERTRGFFLRNGGWYMAINDYMDLTILGTIYSRGTWGITTSSVYNVRYKFSGRFNIDFFSNSVNDDPDFAKSRDLRISWSHSQDPKSNPNRTLSANVNFSTMAYDRNHSYNIDDYITNTKSSSISFSRKWPGKPFNLTANLNQSQNSQTGMMNMTLPNINFNVSRLYPFRGKSDDGRYNWFENITISYSSKMENRITAPDSAFFTGKTLENMKNGFYHSIPISLTNIKILKFINISPGISYNGVMYTNYINRRPDSDTSIFSAGVVTDTIRKLTYAHGLSTSLSVSASPKLYGMLTSTKTNSYISQIRHVMTPSISFGFAPDMSAVMPDYYRTIAYPASITREVKYETYSIYKDNIYGTPVAQGRSGSVSMSLNNNLEMKVRPRNDTTGQPKKVVLLNNLNFSTSYNPFAPGFKWSNLNMSGSTNLFDNKLSLRFGAIFDPYSRDSAGRRVDRYLIKEEGRLYRMTNANINASFRIQSAQGSGQAAADAEGSTQETATVLTPLNESIGFFGADYVNFNIPWSMNFDYNWNYSRQGKTSVFTHTVRLSGDLSLTPKWKIGVNSGFDFISKQFTATNLSIYRDLHCWDMRFSVVPFGGRKSYTFTISAKSSILRDIKYNKSKSWYDNF